VFALVAGVATGCRRAPEDIEPPAVAAVAPLAATPAHRASARYEGRPLGVPRAEIRAPPDEEEPVDPGLPETDLARRDGRPSRSVGTAQNGHIVDARAVPEQGPHHRVVPQTVARSFHFGTDETVELVLRAATRVARDSPGSVMRVGNLSRAGGGDIPPSVSHESGRDVDLLFFATDWKGEPADPPNFVTFDASGESTVRAGDVPRWRFDVERNWLLVKALLSDDVVVQWIFVYTPLRQILVDHAVRIHEPDRLVERARRVLVEPRNSSRHADHFHVRLACSLEDRASGCVDGWAASVGEATRKAARDAQIDAWLDLYHHGSPAEQRYAREMLSLPEDGHDTLLPPSEEADEVDDGKR